MQKSKRTMQEKFPDVETLILGDIICPCWNEQVDLATDLLKFINEELEFKLLFGSPLHKTSPQRIFHILATRTMTILSLDKSSSS